MMHRQGTKIYGLLMMGAKMGPSRLASHALTPVVFMNLAMLRMPPMKTTSVHWPLALASGAVSRPAAKNATSAAMATKPASTPCSFWVIQRIMAMATMMMPCFSFLEMAAFCITGITLLFLAAEKGSSAKDKRNYFGLFVVLMLSYMGRGWAAYICSALVWPGLLGYEYQKGRPIQRQLQLVGAAEVLHLLFVLLTVYGGMAGLSFWANLLWVLLACARGWAALSLYKMQEDA